MLPIYCPLCCDQPFEDQQSLFFHLRGLRNNLFCSICSDKFPTLEGLVSHLSRTCNGPTSPSAKRKVLNISKESPIPDAGSSQNVSKEGETVGQITSSSSPPHVGANALQSSAVVEALQVIPPEIRNRLSKNITLSVESLKKSSKEKNIVCKNTKPCKSGKTETDKEITVSEAVNKVLQKPGVELSLNFQQTKSSNTLSQQTKHSQNKKSPVSSADSSISHSSAQPKPGPLSSKSPEKRKSETPTEESAKKKLHLSENLNQLKKYVQKKVIVGHFSQSSLVSTTTSQNDSREAEMKRSRGRPKKETTTSKDISMKEGKGRGRPRKNSAEINSLPSSPSVTELNNSNQKHLSPTKENNFASQNSYTKLSQGNPFEVTRKVIPVEQKRVEAAACLNGVSGSNSSVNNSKNLKTKEGSSTQPPNLMKTNLTPQNNSTKTSTSGQSTKENKNKVEDKPDEKRSKEGEKSDDEEEEYTCSACNVRFTSIYDHIKKYHNGEEVVVEVPPEEIKEDLKAYQEDPTLKVAIEPNTPDSTQVKKDVESNTKKANLDSKTPRKSAPAKSSLAENKPCNSSKSSNLTQRIKDFAVGKWMHCPTIGKKGFYQYVRDHTKRKILISELLESKSNHKEAKVPLKDLFENPKINVIEITYNSNTPPITHKEVDFKKPMPMYIKEYKCNDEHNMLGGIASYVISSGSKRPCPPVPDSSEIIAVMRVVLASDKALTVENISFKDKPSNENMIPVLEDVLDPKIPLLLNTKILKWRCVKCLTLTWKFPLSAESHACNSCPVCHKTFTSFGALKSHSVMHRKDGSKFCKPCQDTLDSRGLICKNWKHPSNYTLCKLCKLSVVTEQEAEHRLQHEKNPYATLPCSVCKQVFGSVPERKQHETAMCSQLVAKFNCSKCDKKFFSLTALNFHSNKHTNAVQKFPCRYCRKVFILEKELKTVKAGHKKPSSFLRRVWHERIHSRDRPFACAACPKRFRSQSHYRTHFTVVHRSPQHTDITLFPCTQCDRQFSTKDLLSRHVVSHDAPQPSTSSQVDL